MQTQGARVQKIRSFVFRPVFMFEVKAKRLTINPLERVGSKA